MQVFRHPCVGLHTYLSPSGLCLSRTRLSVSVAARVASSPRIVASLCRGYAEPSPAGLPTAV